MVVVVDGEEDEEGGGVGVEPTSLGSRGGASRLCMDGFGADSSIM